MFALKVARPSGSTLVLPRTFPTIVAAKAFTPRGSSKVVAVVYADGPKAGTIAQRVA